MAKQNTFISLPLDTLVDIVAIKQVGNNIESITIAQMTIKDWQNIKKKPGFIYRAYQKGFQQFKINKK